MTKIEKLTKLAKKNYRGSFDKFVKALGFTAKEQRKNVNSLYSILSKTAHKRFIAYAIENGIVYVAPTKKALKELLS